MEKLLEANQSGQLSFNLLSGTLRSSPKNKILVWA